MTWGKSAVIDLEHRTDLCGRVVGDYRIEECIGRGGFGEVYRVEQLSLRRTVALKILSGSRLVDRHVRSRFLREAALVARLSHPAVVPVYEAGEAEGMLFYSMQLVQGIPLDQYVRKQRLEPQAVVRLMEKVCDGVQAAHRKGILHRDLKPENILVDASGQPRILDFGLAKILTAEAAEFTMVSIEGAILGTPLFMAPEQTTGHPDDMDIRTDVYALGVLLYVLLTDAYPYDTSGTVHDLLQRIRENNPVPLRTRVRKLPLDLEAVVLKALSKRPEHRYQTAGELAEDARNWLEDRPVTARTLTPGYRLRKVVRRHWWALSMAGGLFLVLVLSVTYFMMRLNRERRRALHQGGVARQAVANLARMAPTCARQARLLVQRQDFDAALKMIDHAIQLDDGPAGHHLLRGHILQSLHRIAEAAMAYERALECKPDLGGAKENLALCQSILERDGPEKELSVISRQELLQALRKQERYAEAASLLRTMEADARVYYDVFAPMLKERGLGTLYLKGGVLEFTASRALTDLSVLRGLPLSVVNIDNTPVSDLTPLRGMASSLRALHASGSKIRDLSPLKGLRLEVLYVGSTKVRDLSPLRGMPLRVLGINATKVDDLSSLQGMSLRRLEFASPADVDFQPIMGMPLEDINVNSHPIRSFSFLAGMPLQNLSAKGVLATDLGPLGELPLRHLNLHFLGNDISPLAKCPLRRLTLVASAVTAIEALRGLPLEYLDLAWCTKLRDFSPLTDCKELKEIVLSGNAADLDLEPLRTLRQLETINEKRWTAFWNEYDRLRQEQAE